MNNELRAALDELLAASFDQNWKKEAEARAAVEALFAEVVKDTERLGFLENEAYCYWVEILAQPSGRLIYAGNGPALREAIDSARSAVSPEVTK